WSRQLRWARTVRWVRPVSIGTIFCHATFWALVLMVTSGFSLASLDVLAAVLGIRIGTSAIIIGRVLKMPELMRDAWMVALKALLAAVIWLTSLFGSEVTWAGQRFRISKDGTMRAVKKRSERSTPAVQTSQRTVSESD